MIQLILAGIGFSIWSLYIIITYYSNRYSNINHIEVTTDFGGYILSILIIYGLYKVYMMFYSRKRTISYNFFHIVGFALLHLLVMCIAYTSYTQSLPLSSFFAGVKPSSMVLFFHILSLLAFPVILTCIVRALGFSVLANTLKSWSTESLRFRVPVEITTGFLILSTSLLLLGHFNLYNLTGLLGILGFFTLVSYQGFIETYKNIRENAVIYDNHSFHSGILGSIAPRLISAEIAFFFVTFLINISLINAIRPMPIGWDDLGAYMNFPKIMALTESYILGAGMYAWQLITGTGYLFSYTASQAFYINQLGGILAVITLTTSLSLLLEVKNKKLLLSLPLILATIFYAMPMNIFQQAKDMKLDPALLFMSISAFMVLYVGYRENSTTKKTFTYTLLAGILVGFAFSVKFTTLMLILTGLGYIAYRKGKIGGFFGFFFLFLAIFTKLNLWKQLNLWLPTDRPEMINWSVIILIGLSLLSFGYAFIKEKGEALKIWGLSTCIFIGGILLGVSPWLLKNLSEVGITNLVGVDKTTLINSIVNGSGGNFVADFSKIYNPEEYKSRQDAEKSAAITSDGKSLNEDLGRYFGYEKGMNNYLKLPANLTFQKNQPGEFTDITFIYLAFIPAILLFIRGRRHLFPLVIAGLLTFMFTYYFTSYGRGQISDFFGRFELPGGYLIVLIFNIIFILLTYFFIDESEENARLKEIMMALGIYGFLFWISTFGIVWYGILVYFLFLALIGLSSLTFVSYTDDEEKDGDLMSVKITLTAIFSIFIITYFIRSAFPHGWNNLREASYNEFKYHILNQEEAIFAYRSDYITPIAHLNLKDVPKVIEKIKSEATSKNLKDLFLKKELTGIEVREFAYLLLQISQTKDPVVRKDAKNLANTLFRSILYPTKDIRNEGGIYRIGTFMTYLIDRNRQRYFDDSLIFSFDTYFYDANPELTIDRMKKMGFKYLLIDLNAATIDKDPRHALTTRFEHLLHTMKARNLKLIDTDSLCLKFAIDMYQNGEFTTPDEYVDVAGTNYESYRMIDGSEKVISRNQKQAICFNSMLRKMYTPDGISKYPYLAEIKKVIDSENAYGSDPISQQKLQRIFAQFFTQSWFALFEIYDAPKIAEPLVPTESLSTNTGTSASGIIITDNTNTGSSALPQ